MSKTEESSISSPSGLRNANRIAFCRDWRRALCQRPGLVRRRSLPGQVMLLATIALVTLLGLAGLATDAGILWTEKRQMQSAADAAAVAGALAVDRSGDVTAAAKTDASINHGISMPLALSRIIAIFVSCFGDFGTDYTDFAQSTLSTAQIPCPLGVHKMGLLSLNPFKS